MEISHVGFMSLQVVVWFLLLTHSSGSNEVTSLIDFKNGVKDSFNILTSWDPAVSPCNWFSIKCDKSNHVTRIDLGNAGLSGSISPSLGNLTNLQYLELYQNKLSGSMPKELGKLANLVSLDLYSNNLTGQIPHEFGNLKSLTTLRLNNNNLCGLAPVESLSHCTKLKDVVMYPNPKLCNPFKFLIKDCPSCP